MKVIIFSLGGGIQPIVTISPIEGETKILNQPTQRLVNNGELVNVFVALWNQTL